MSEQKEATNSNAIAIAYERPKYEEIVTVDIMDGLQEFCDEFSCIIVPPTDEDIQYAKISGNNEKDNDSESATLLMLESLNNLIYELSDNLNKSIVRIEELQSAGNGLSASISFCGKTVINNLEIRVNEINEMFEQIDIIKELIKIIECQYVNKFAERYEEIALIFCDENNIGMIQKQLKKDPIGTIKKQYKKTVKQNKPKIKNEINIQKEKLKKIKNNLQFSAKNVFSKLKQNQNIFSKAKDMTTEKTTNDLKVESDEFKQKNINKTQIINKEEEEPEPEQEQEAEKKEEDEDQIKAMHEYKWSHLPVLPDWNELIQNAKQRYNENNKNKNDKNNNLYERKIKWLSEQKIDDEQDSNFVKNEKHSIDLP